MAKKRYINITKKKWRKPAPKRKTETAIYIVLICVFICFSAQKANPPKAGYPDFGQIDNVENTQPISTYEPRGVNDAHFDIEEIPDYSGTPTYVLNGNIPSFTKEEYNKASNSYIALSDLDLLNRCGVCEGSLGEDTLPEEDREDISSIRPTGWHQENYPDLISKNDGALYNRCHLLMYALTGLNAEPRNLITGTEYFNNKGMLPYETAVVKWIQKNGGRVLYRVTPVFEDTNLLCSGVHIEAGDVDSGGKNFHINVYCYNVEPGVKLDYATGYSTKEINLNL